MNKAHEFIEKSIRIEDIDGDIVESLSVHDAYTAIAIAEHTLAYEIYINTYDDQVKQQLEELLKKIEQKYKFLKGGK